MYCRSDFFLNSQCARALQVIQVHQDFASIEMTGQGYVWTVKKFDEAFSMTVSYAFTHTRWVILYDCDYQSVRVQDDQVL